MRNSAHREQTTQEKRKFTHDTAAYRPLEMTRKNHFFIRSGATPSTTELITVRKSPAKTQLANFSQIFISITYQKT